MKKPKPNYFDMKKSKPDYFGIILLGAVALAAVVGLILLLFADEFASVPVPACLDSWKEKISADYGCELIATGYANFECQFDDGLVFTFKFPKSVIKECE